jgi:hypothetical protein
MKERPILAFLPIGLEAEGLKPWQTGDVLVVKA